MKRFFKYTILAILFIILWSWFTYHGTNRGWWHTPFTQATEVDVFTKDVKRELGNEFVGNFAMALIENGKVSQELFHSIGQEVDKNTVFQVASLSKFVSATGVMKLVELGKIDLDAPVSNYLTRWDLPESEFDNEEVTVRRLLSHTAGLTDGLGYAGFTDPNEVQSLEASLTKALDADPGRNGEVKVGIKPGSEWRYSGGGFTLLQLIVEEVSKQPFSAFMTENIFQPLGMHHSSYRFKDIDEATMCGFYHQDGTKAPHFHYTSLAATSLYTTLSDLEKFFQLFIQDKGDPHRVLHNTQIAMMQRPHAVVFGAPVYGLGTFLYIDIDPNSYIIGHDGNSSPPINTALRINPKTGDGIIILETGHPDLATKIASDWVFLQTGKVDALLFVMIQDRMLHIMGIGVLTIIFGTTSLGLFRRRRRRRRRRNTAMDT